MKDFQQRKKIRSFVTSRLGFFSVLLVTILLFKGAWGVFQKERETQASLERAKTTLIIARNREVELSTSVKNLQTPQGVEKEIRNKFDVAKNGEEVIMVVDPKQAVDTGGGEVTSFWQKIGNWFKSIF
jgi:cell division protein FtsB